MIDYRLMLPSDVETLKSLWLKCFNDKEEAAELFFKRNINYTHGYVAADGDIIVSAVYLIDCKLCGKPAHYLCGAATMPEYRNRGIMTGLIEFALNDAEIRGDCYSVLLPADEGLYDFYAKLGYLEGCSACRREFQCYSDTAITLSEEPDYQILQKCSADNFLIWNNSYIKFAEEYYACYGIKALKSKNAFALLEQDGESAEVFYAIYNSMSELNKILVSEGIKRFWLIGSAYNPVFTDTEPKRCGMIKPLNSSKVLNDVFIGIGLD